MPSPLPPEPAGGAAGPPPPSSKSRVTWRIALRNTAIISLITIILVEIILRALGVANPVLYERDVNTGYRLKPNQHVTYFGNTIHINEHGVRDARTLERPDPFRKRVLVLGDSVTWGGVLLPQDALFTSVAESHLEYTDIINAGVNGYSVNQMAKLYRTHLESLRPDIVIVCVIPRDFERPPITRLSGKGVAFPETRPALALLHAMAICRQVLQDRYHWKWLSVSPATAVEAQSEFTYEDVNVRSISELRKEIHCPLLLVFLPSQDTESERKVRQTQIAELPRIGVSAIDIGGQLETSPRDFIDRVHLSADGHKKIGTALAAVIQDFAGE
ncbi:MAG: SGNH/GDSL hydrolase family protein [Candidatus Hydrogenedentes bacterium]|nr:SGNH/GDSL hydrolase family protein [Candidatus Hydrogenedentota bacterium]